MARRCLKQGSRRLSYPRTLCRSHRPIYYWLSILGKGRDNLCLDRQEDLASSVYQVGSIHQRGDDHQPEASVQNKSFQSNQGALIHCSQDGWREPSCNGFGCHQPQRGSLE